MVYKNKEGLCCSSRRQVGAGCFPANRRDSRGVHRAASKRANRSCQVVAVGQSPKTEYMWFETQMDDSSGKRIAEMRMLLRWMKASSSRYPELQKQA